MARKKPKVYVLPAAFDAQHGYCAKVIDVEDYGELEFEADQLRASHAALRAAVRKVSNAKAIFAHADKLAKALGVVA